MKATVFALILGVGLIAWAQGPAKVPDDLKFEVASIKPTPPEVRGGSIRPSPGGQGYIASGVSVRLMMTVAYRLKADQIEGGPSWLDTERYEINAKSEKPASVDELHVMLRNLMAERFNLKFHLTKKEMPAFVLTVEKGGPKMEAHASTNAGEPWIDQAQEKPLHLNLAARSVMMDYFAFRLSQILPLPVVDRTDLKGEFDFKLNYTAELPPNIQPDAVFNGQPIDTTGPTIFEALKQQLGLKLEKTKAPIDVAVIDHLEKPTAN